jgi:hypothetical protein
MFIVGMVRMQLDIMVRAIVFARVPGCGLWMFGALCDMAFQVAFSPIRWAMEKGRAGALCECLVKILLPFQDLTSSKDNYYVCDLLTS